MPTRQCINGHHVTDDAAAFCPLCGVSLATQLRDLQDLPDQRALARRRRNRTILWIGGSLLFLCLACSGLAALGSTTEATATRQATRTAGAHAAAQTQAALPTATLRPTTAPSLTPIPSPTQPTPTPTVYVVPTLTGHAMTVAAIEHSYDRMTALQWDEYVRDVVGLRVHWAGTVSNVSDRGTIYVEMGQKWLHNIYLEGIAREAAMEMRKGQAIEFEATISKVTTFLGLSIWLDDPVVFH